MSIYFYFYKETLLYIGSSMDIKARIEVHKSKLKNGNTMPFYKYLREQNLTFENLELEDVKTEITDKIELVILEQKCQDLYEPICNMRRAYSSKEDKKEYDKEYRKTDKYKEYYKEYRKTDKSKAYEKEYQKEYKKEYNKEYEKSDKRKEYKKEYNKEYRARKKAEEAVKEI